MLGITWIEKSSRRRQRYCLFDRFALFSVVVWTTTAIEMKEKKDFNGFLGEASFAKEGSMGSSPTPRTTMLKDDGGPEINVY
jgi:hypothetical protein